MGDLSGISAPALAGIRYVISVITTFARYPFPGTDIPVIAIPIGCWGIYMFWRWFLAQFFDVETKK